MSDFFEWNAPKYGLGVKPMDDEHKTLIGLMNALHAKYATNNSAASLRQPLDALVKFTQKHFADEEAYMASIKFPGLRVHQNIHKQLLDKIGEFAKSFESTGKLTDPFFEFLRYWLSAHICGIDTKYASHSKQAKAS